MKTHICKHNNTGHRKYLKTELQVVYSSNPWQVSQKGGSGNFPPQTCPYIELLKKIKITCMCVCVCAHATMV